MSQLPRPQNNPLSDELRAQLVDDPGGYISAKTHRKLRWRCEKGHEWEAAVSSRTTGHGCPYCSGRFAVEGVDDLATLRPDLTAQLVNPKEAVGVPLGSGKRLEWRCEKGHTWRTPVRTRVRGCGCPICSGHGERLDHLRPLVTEARADVLHELVDEHSVDGLTCSSGKIVSWRCDKCGYVYEQSVKKHLSGQGCPVCAGHKVVVGINDLWTTHPKLASELVDARVGYTVSSGSVKKLEWRCKQGHTWSAAVCSRISNAKYGGNGCPVCAREATSSIAEDDLYECVCGMVGADRVERHVRNILPGGLELDILVRDAGVAIEYNGLWWHSEDAGHGRDYHKRKYDLARKSGIRLVQVWEDTWRDHRQAVLEGLAVRLGVDKRRRVFARNAFVVEVSGYDAGMFMDRYHIQGRSNAQWHYGLLESGELVAVISARREKGTPGSIEICRYATAAHVIGGFSKLLSHAIQGIRDQGEHVDKVVSFSANDVSDGHMYEACGFEVVREVPPEYCYAGHRTNDTRAAKRTFQRKRFRDDPALEWDESWIEAEAAQRNGLWRIWDAGKLKWAKSV